MVPSVSATRQATGDMIIVCYADALVVGFEHESDGWRFGDAIRERLQEFAPTLHPERPDCWNLAAMQRSP